MLDLASEKGASSWLTALPLKSFGYVLNQQEFADALALRYNFQIKDVAKVCVCGEVNSVNHCLICKKGGYVSLRHNWVRDTISKLLVNVKCKDVQIEPHLLSTRGYQLPSGSITADQARLDISARSVWNMLGRAFFDVRVFHAPAPSNMNKSIPQMYSHHENLKKRSYNARVIEVEKGTFTPLVFSTTGGMGREAQKLLKILAEKTELKTGQSYSDAMGFMRKRLRFELLKTTIIALRGYRGKRTDGIMDIGDLDLNLEPINNSDLDLVIVDHEWWGKGVIKKCQVSPDAFIQMAIQIAYYKDSGKSALTYEASMTRLYLCGRTETVRSCTMEASAFVKAMMDKDVSREEKIRLFVISTDRHQNLYRDAMNGKGIDRHIFALYVACKGLGYESDFLKNIISRPWTLSTSQQPQQQQTVRVPDANLEPYRDKFSPGGGFGPVSDAGYGISYMLPNNFNIFFHVSSKKSSPDTDSTRFVKYLFESLAELKNLFEQ
ncbi:Carnitine O-palmitoyltransferase 1, liver isoform [Nymphon striatum]|nr:Carnitine O-palmitoyltransferase 1, liver isoform [Nymphon striatum]